MTSICRRTATASPASRAPSPASPPSKAGSCERAERANHQQRAIGEPRRPEGAAVTTILGIETSCDETAAAVVRDGHDVLSSVVSSQVDLHARYGGVVPELASRAHVQLLTPVVAEALVEAGVDGPDIDAVAC